MLLWTLLHKKIFFEKRYPLVFSGPERSVRYTLFLANIHFWTPNTISNHMIWSNLPHTWGETKSLLAHGVLALLGVSLWSTFLPITHLKNGDGKRVKESLESVWTHLSAIAQSCSELCKCGCKKQCSGRCSCRQSNLPCTSRCSCPCMS